MNIAWMAAVGRGCQFLLELALDVGEGVVDAAADCSRAADDGDRDEGCDQAVFDGRGAGFVLEKACYEFHVVLRLQ